MTPEDLRAALLGTDDLVVEAVATPEWPLVDGQIYVRRMSGTQRERYLDSIRVVTGAGKAMVVTVPLVETGAKLAAATLCDAHGVLLFTPADVAALGAKSSTALARVTDVAARLNGLDEAAVEAAKNASAAMPIAASSTASPAISG